MNELRGASAMSASAVARVLVGEDDPVLAELRAYNLKAEGFAVESVGRGDEAERLLVENSYDLVVLDWMLPGISGLEICRRLRESERTRLLPVVMVTACGEEDDRVRGLSVGADDYVVKPFSLPELIARIHALLRRRTIQSAPRDLTVGDIRINREAMRGQRAGRELRLTAIEFRLLECLLAQAGRVLSRSQLRDAVWGHTADVGRRSIDVYVGRLRRALSRPHERDPIRTVRDFGYSFDETYGLE